MKIDDFELDIVVQGFPGKSVCHGGEGRRNVAVAMAGYLKIESEIGTGVLA
jgi:hypothetical protein